MITYYVIVNKYGIFIENFVDEDTGEIVSITRAGNLIGKCLTTLTLPRKVKKATLSHIIPYILDDKTNVYKLNKVISYNEYIELLDNEQCKILR